MSQKTTALLITGIVLAAGLGVMTGYIVWNDDENDGALSDSYDAGYAAGRAVGYDDGYEAGYVAGGTDNENTENKDGPATGNASGGTSSNNAGYNSGYKNGYDDGYVAGYDDGMTIGYDAGYADGSYDASTTYWFYIDFGDESAFESKWLSSRSNTAADALRSALDDEEIPYSMSSLGALTVIGDAENHDTRSFETVYEEFMEFEGEYEDFDWTLSGYSWYLWFWSTNISYAGSWIESDGYISQSIGVYFYIGFSSWEWDMVSPLPTVDIDPSAETAWKNNGPFA